MYFVMRVLAAYVDFLKTALGHAPQHRSLSPPRDSYYTSPISLHGEDDDPSMEAARSLIEIAYNYMKQQFIHGAILPGSMLSENEIASQLGISRTPVRHAISRLEAEGLVQPLKKRGVLVKEISFQENCELYENIMALMQYAAYVIELEGCKEMERLRDIYEQQLAATNNEDYHTYIQLSASFNACFVSSIRNRAMLQSMEKFQDRVVLFGIMNYRKTPHEPHFSATPLNGSILHALEEQNYGELRTVLRAASSRIRQVRSIY